MDFVVFILENNWYGTGWNVRCRNVFLDIWVSFGFIEVGFHKPGRREFIVC